MENNIGRVFIIQNRSILDFGIFLQIMRYHGDGPKSKHGIYLHFMHVLCTYIGGKVYTIINNFVQETKFYGVEFSICPCSKVSGLRIFWIMFLSVCVCLSKH